DDLVDLPAALAPSIDAPPVGSPAIGPSPVARDVGRGAVGAGGRGGVGGGSEGDVHGVRVGQEVVQGDEDLLGRPQQEDAQVIGLDAGRLPRQVVDLVQLEDFLVLALVHEVVDLAVGVAGDVGEDAAAGGLFGQPVDGDDREELVDGPGVGHGLEEG